jgi:hypothetical protein
LGVPQAGREPTDWKGTFVEVSYFKGRHKAKGHIKNIAEVVDHIKSGTHRKLIESIKAVLSQLFYTVYVFHSPKGGLHDQSTLND